MKKEELERVLSMKEKFKEAINKIIDEEFDLLLKQVESGRYKITERDINEILVGLFSASHSAE